jgi:hypothetical protein
VKIPVQPIIATCSVCGFLAHVQPVMGPREIWKFLCADDGGVITATFPRERIRRVPFIGPAVTPMPLTETERRAMGLYSRKPVAAERPRKTLAAWRRR